MARSKKLVHIRQPKVRITSKGVRTSKPSARIGGKTGLNISSHGVSASTRTPIGTFNSKHGFILGGRQRRNAGCALGLLVLAVLVAALARVKGLDPIEEDNELTANRLKGWEEWRR